MFQETKQMKFHSTEINPNHQTVTLTFRLNLQWDGGQEQMWYWRSSSSHPHSLQLFPLFIFSFQLFECEVKRPHYRMVVK